MHPATVTLHQTLLRLGKGMWAAYEQWLMAVSGAKVPRSGEDWLKQAEIVAAAQVITSTFNARQREDIEARSTAP